MTSAVVDASCLVKLFLEQQGHGEVREWVLDAVKAGVPIMAPMLATYEVGNVIQREFSDGTRAERLERHDLALGHVRLVDPPSERVFEAAGPITYYDAAYVALALDEGAELVTSDQGMAARAEELGVTTRTL